MTDEELAVLIKVTTQANTMYSLLRELALELTAADSKGLVDLENWPTGRELLDLVNKTDMYVVHVS